MPRRQIAETAGLVFHVLNRGVRRMQLFDRPGDYHAFLGLVARAQHRTPLRCLAYCLMPNHFHFVLWPDRDGQLSDFMFWLSMVHSQRWHAAHATRGTGPVYQGRFKAIPVSADAHFLRLCRYVEQNPLRAGLVDRAEQWPWSSLAQRSGLRRPVGLTDWPVGRPDDWVEIVNGGVSSDTEEIRRSVRRGAPYGPDLWREKIAASLALTKSLAPLGRPSKSKPGVFFLAP
jgi:putative transposase